MSIIEENDKLIKEILEQHQEILVMLEQEKTNIIKEMDRNEKQLNIILMAACVSFLFLLVSLFFSGVNC
jgi:hypothetical protein